MDATFVEELEAMDAGALAAGAGLVGFILAFMLVFALVWFFLSAIGFYKMNQKAGEAGWKAFVPCYAAFIRFKYSWNTKMFWIYFVGFAMLQATDYTENVLLSLVLLIGGIAALVVKFKLDMRTAKSFGKSTGMGLLLFLLPFIASLILGFGKAQYIGNTTTNA